MSEYLGCVKCQKFIYRKGSVKDMCDKCVEYCNSCEKSFYHYEEQILCDECDESICVRCAGACKFDSCQKTVCKKCSSSVENGEIVCTACYNKKYKPCSSCEKMTYIYNLSTEAYTELLKCEYCVTECQECHDAYPVNKLSNNYCENCTNNCSVCAVIIYPNDYQTCHSCGEFICSGCRQDCEICDESYENNYYATKDDYRYYCPGCVNTRESSEKTCTMHTPLEYYLLQKERQKSTILELAIASKTGFAMLPYDLLQDIFKWLDL
jgi:hypothetical protein